MQTKVQKQERIQELERFVKDQKGMVFVDVQGIKVKEITVLRNSLKQMGAKMTIVKKTLFQKALEGAGKELNLKGFQGQIAAIFAFEDLLPALKEAKAFGKKQQMFQVKGGYFEGEFQTALRMLEIADIPSRQELLSGLAESLAAPMSKLTTVLQGNIKGLLRVLANAKT
ncbi:MAG: 50S ribosomal protein L10 [Parcubacteria group bacterium]|nr:50S ribosomal protein L10 [Parcubacteria group bacterium]